MNKLNKVKKIIKYNFYNAKHGLFSTRNVIMRDPMVNIYNKDGITVNICYRYSYFEVLGITDDEFKELKEYYNKLQNNIIIMRGGYER